jgi:hypothetical protein
MNKIIDILDNWNEQPLLTKLLFFWSAVASWLAVGAIFVGTISYVFGFGGFFFSIMIYVLGSMATGFIIEDHCS